MHSDDVAQSQSLDVEEIEELHSLEDEPVSSVPPPEDIPAAVLLMGVFERIPVPSVVMDEGFLIHWGNEAYKNEFSDGSMHLESSLFTLFRNPLEQTSLADIYRALRAPEAGYCWAGKMNIRREGRRAAITQVQVIPIFGESRSDCTPAAYAGILQDITDDYHQILHNTFMSLLEASVMKDKDTGKHVQRVNYYSKLIAQSLYESGRYKEIDIDFIEDIGFLASMHDVGKIGTPDDILNKEGRLEKWEWEIMKEHTINGAYILSTYPNPMAKEIALFHHEKWDGTGYTGGLSGTMIPLSARIVAIADVYDALRSRRSYKEGFSHTQVLSIIEKERGKHFDPAIVEVFLKEHERFQEIYNSLSDDNR